MIPTQVRLALQGNDFRAPFEPIAPAVPVTTGSIERVNGVAGAAALEFLASTTMVLEHLARQPAAMLKDGGIGRKAHHQPPRSSDPLPHSGIAGLCGRQPSGPW